mmetsp:Transcript_36245/g.108785  ORF Transcript_36245/g.108785 Transcript_36245/m.108785 type:complete len:301 (+) Transcript_36245:1035-1937(+)
MNFDFSAAISSSELSCPKTGSDRSSSAFSNHMLNAEAFFAKSSISESITSYFSCEAASWRVRSSEAPINRSHRWSTVVCRLSMSSPLVLPSLIKLSLSAVNAATRLSPNAVSDECSVSCLVASSSTSARSLPYSVDSTCAVLDSIHAKIESASREICRKPVMLYSSAVRRTTAAFRSVMCCRAASAAWDTSVAERFLAATSWLACDPRTLTRSSWPLQSTSRTRCFRPSASAADSVVGIAACSSSDPFSEIQASSSDALAIKTCAVISSSSSSARRAAAASRLAHDVASLAAASSTASRS